jgi:hypothetical protein
VSRPYLTAEEYRRAPSGVDASALVPGDAAASATELVNIIGRASSWIDQLCNQVLSATVDTESGRFRVGRDGLLRIHCRYSPIVAVTGFSYGAAGSAVTPVTDLSRVWVEDAAFVVPLIGARAWTGPIEFGGIVRPGGEAYCQWEYVNGWPNTTLAAPAAAGATQISVTDGTGLVPGVSRITLYDNNSTETVTVAAGYTFGSLTVPLTGPLQYAHDTVGISVSGLPPVIKQAAVLTTSALIKTRSASAIVMGGMRSQPETKTPGNALNLDEMADVREMLRPFARVR